ncbi:thyroid receptor-interacting protein 11 [Ditylenchus destructor]|nr:thyroid receptor-interacting protein 11 [Ditylenchus destructor]
MNFLRNIQAQVNELATEVLQQATEEVEDPESELQVERKKCAEAERQLMIEKSKAEDLLKKVNELEEHLYSASLENDATREKFEHIIYDRDLQIKNLATEIEHSRFEKDDSMVRPPTFQSVDLTSNEKFAARDFGSSSKNDSIKTSNTAKEIAHLREKHEQEIQALMSVNAENVKHLREEYESRIHELQSWGADITQPVGEITDVSGKLNIEHEKLQDLLEEMKQRARTLESEIKCRDQTIEQLKTELSARNIEENSAAETEENPANREEKDAEIERLKSMNSEMMCAYNELSKEFEEYKSQNAAVAVTNSDLMARIDALKANLIEYESRYDLCKSDHQDTANQLEKLTEDFERLRSSMEASRSLAESNEEKLNREVLILREALDQAKIDGGQLRSDINRFRESMKSIDDELSQLRDANQRLAQENQKLGEYINEKVMEVADLREQLAETRLERDEQIDRVNKEKEAFVQLLESVDKVKMDHVEAGTQTEEIVTVSTETLTDPLKGGEQNIVAQEQHGAEIFSKERRIKRHPSSDAEGTDSGSNNGWERMGGEWVAPDVLPSGVSTSSCSGSTSNGEGKSHRGDAITIPEGARVDLHAEISNTPQSSPKCGSSVGHSDEGDEGEIVSNIEESATTKEPKASSPDSLVNSLRQSLNEKSEELAVQQKIQEETLIMFKAREEEMKQREECIGRLQADLQEQIREFEQREQKLIEYHQQEVQKAEETVKLLQHQLDSVANDSNSELVILLTTNEELVKEKEELKSVLERLRNENFEQSNNLAAALTETDQIKATFTEICEKCALLEEEIESSKKESLEHRDVVAESHRIKTELDRTIEQCSNLQAEIEKLRNDATIRSEDSQKTAEKHNEIEQLIHQNTELKRIVEEKHAESQKYYEKLQEFASLHGEGEQKLKIAEQQLAESREYLSTSQEEREKLQKEVVRLREHLLVMEDMGTKEAIAAEERETQLREEIRQLQERTSTFSFSAAESETQNKIALLRVQLVSGEEHAAKVRSQLADKEKSLSEATKALSNLQNVLREIADDHAQEIAQLEKEVESARNQHQTTSSQLSELRAHQIQLVEDRRYFEDSVTLLREDLARKSALIEELENHVEELRHAASKSASPRVSQRAGDQSPANTYKIDDVTLKQLFLSYFLSDKTKQPEIAFVMASILGYSQQEQSLIHQSVLAQGEGGSWLGFIGRRSGISNVQKHGPSLTEQFVRFLESESRTTNEQPTLPVQNDPTAFALRPDALPPRLTGQAQPTPTSSASDLKSILES